MLMTIQRRFFAVLSPGGRANNPTAPLDYLRHRGVAGITERVAAMSPKGRPA